MAALGTGVIPALRAGYGPAIPTQGGGGTATPGARHLQRTMCVVQVALAVTLLIGAALLGRSLVRLLGVDLGVSTDHVLTASMNLAFGERPTDAQALARVTRVIDKVRTLPGVRAVGVGTGLPPAVSRMTVTLRRHGDAVDYQAAAVPATPGYFSALQMRLIKGRFFTEADDDQVADAAAQAHFRTVLLASLAGLALGIAVVGLYGVVAYAVSQRTKEFGIRIALGATSHDVLGMVLSDGMTVALAGIGLGVVTSLVLARLLAGLLYGIAPTDPVSYLVASMGLQVLTLLASYIPARRAARVDPIRALRDE